MEDSPHQPRPLSAALLGLQGVAVLAVLLFHLHHLARLPLPPALAFVGTHFGLGVQALFVLGSFQLCHAVNDLVGRGNWIRAYCLRGFMRIVPLFYLVLAMWVVLLGMRGRWPDVATLALNLSCAFGLVPGKHESLVPGGWVVGVAMIFCGLFPLLVATIRELPSAIGFLVVAAVVSGFGRAALVERGDWLAGYAPVSFVAALVVFAVGMAAYHGWRLVNADRRGVVLVALVTVGLAAVLVSPLRNRLLDPARPDIMLWSLCFGGLAIWQAAAPGRVLSSAALHFLGARSYGVYLLHPLVIVLCEEPIRRLHAAGLPMLGDWAFLVAGGFVAAVVVAGATAVYALVEAPAMRAGRWLAGRVPVAAAEEAETGRQWLPPEAMAEAGAALLAAIHRLLSGRGWTWLNAALALVMLGFSGWVAMQAIDQPLVDIHAFRQTQTALSAEWMVREGWRIDYETPVAGAPWSIPFEFPVYQMLVAAVVAVTGLDLSATGRFTSWLFLVGCGWPAFAVARRLQLPGSAAAAFCGLLWSAQLYVYWGRTFMIETAALFFTLACLPWWLDAIGGRGGWRSRLLFLACAALAVLQKSTTGGPVLLVLLVVGLGRWLLPGPRTPAARTGATWAVALTLAALAAGGLWAAHADTVKLANPMGRMLTGGGLSTWNFGSLAQKFDPQTWQKVIWERGFVWNAAGFWAVALLLAFWAWPGGRVATEHRRDRRLVLVCLTLYLLPILIFTNLHLVHDYYQVACVAFLLAALAVVIGSWLPRVTGLAAAAPLALLPFLITNIQTYRSYYGIVVARPLEQQPKISVERFRLGKWLREATPPGSGLVVFGQAWSSELPFHAGRKACVCPAWYPDLPRAWQHPEELLGGLPLGAIVVSPEPGKIPSAEDIAARVAAGGWQYDVVEGSSVLRPERPVRAAVPPTDPGDPTTAPR